MLCLSLGYAAARGNLIEGAIDRRIAPRFQFACRILPVGSGYGPPSQVNGQKDRSIQLPRFRAHSTAFAGNMKMPPWLRAVMHLPEALYGRVLGLSRVQVLYVSTRCTIGFLGRMAEFLDSLLVSLTTETPDPRLRTP